MYIKKDGKTKWLTTYWDAIGGDVSSTFNIAGNAIYDGDKNLNNASWKDTNGLNEIALTNTPTYITGSSAYGHGLNGHGTILFDGANEYGNSTTPIIAQPYTMYLVARQITWTNLDYIFSDGVTADILESRQVTGTPTINLIATPPGNSIETAALVLNVWNVITVVMNGAASGFRIGLNTIATADLGNTGRAGITLASNVTVLNRFGNVEFAYIIMRNGADSTAVQDQFINWLKNHFAI